MSKKVMPCLMLTHSLCSVLFPLSDQKNITVQSGQTVSLPCQAPNNKGTIRVVRWTKPGLQNENVYLYVDRRFYLEEQNPSFKNRVDLQDRQMKDGNVSLILKDVTVNDAGTYKCLIRVLLAASTNDHINNITLRVVPPGEGEAASWLLMFVSKDVADETFHYTYMYITVYYISSSFMNSPN
uniref:Ig-like domain-containing protein n=1 Tax=Oreochromis aureus TaxID=47969 RepID=A0A668SRJ5_OREAU